MMLSTMQTQNAPTVTYGNLDPSKFYSLVTFDPDAPNPCTYRFKTRTREYTICI
jgi:hypothetical protein